MIVTLTFEWTTILFIGAAAVMAWFHGSMHELRKQNKFMEEWLNTYDSAYDEAVKEAAERADLP